LTPRLATITRLRSPPFERSPRPRRWGRADPAAVGEAFGALEEERAPGVRESVRGRPVGSVAVLEEAASDEAPQVRLESGASDGGIRAPERAHDPQFIARPVVALAAGDGLETVALEGGEFDPGASAVPREVTRERCVCSSGVLKVPRIIV